MLCAPVWIYWEESERRELYRVREYYTPFARASLSTLCISRTLLSHLPSSPSPNLPNSKPSLNCKSRMSRRLLQTLLLLFTSSPDADNFIFPKDASGPTITNNDPSQCPSFTAGDKQVFAWAIDATSTGGHDFDLHLSQVEGVRISSAVSCQLPNSLLSPQAAN